MAVPHQPSSQHENGSRSGGWLAGPARATTQEGGAGCCGRDSITFQDEIGSAFQPIGVLEGLGQNQGAQWLNCFESKIVTNQGRGSPSF